ncbi:MAG TPA: choice-of-anchor tandem repeat GloVer-containing protein [Terriglobales bacterium]|nr:choice-of-anchor tandem repeat GloVer-containing protein [Terriglobales bacterium]
MRYVASFLVSIVLFASTSSASSAPTISQVFAFACNQDFTSCPDGFDPALGPIQLATGFLYGTTWWAGQGNANAGGTVFKVTTTGSIAVLHTFQPGTGGKFAEGENPVLGFVRGPDGAFYGTTESGGAHKAGVMYRLTPRGSFNVLYNFCSLGGCPDGPGPLLLAKDGNFYGAENETIFRITPRGQWSLLYGLNATNDGTAQTLIQGSDGNFYGTGTIYPETGTIFRVTPKGQFTILYQLPEFERITTKLVQASDGNFYGGTSTGAVFQFTLSRTFTVIATLTQGEGPTPTFLLQASDGNLWGLCMNGGTAPDRPGTVFAVTPSGTVLTSAEFNCASDGCNPEGMIQGSDGNFYGVAISGGTAPGHPLGTVFKIDAGLAPH